MNHRRKELVEQYKRRKPDMGIFIIRRKGGKRCFLETSANVPAFMNRVRFQLNHGSHPNRELQRDWKEHGEPAFDIEVLELLKYDKDETKTDYSEELAILKMVWEEKLLAEGMSFYRK